MGILGNLFDPHHFGVGRQATVSGDESTLQTFCLKADDDSSGDAREALTLKRMQTVIDGIASVSGLEPDLILCNSAMRSAYIDLLNGNVNAMSFDPKSAATTVDGGVTGISFAGKPIRTSRHVPPGMFIFLNTSTFKLAILEDGKFADMDGNVLSRVTGADAFEGFYKWYYNHYCYRPNANGVLARSHWRKSDLLVWVLFDITFVLLGLGGGVVFYQLSRYLSVARKIKEEELRLLLPSIDEDSSPSEIIESIYRATGGD